jgi:carbon monoxide dehydrogenase subunit G
MRMESSVVVNRPIEEVWAFWNTFNLPRASRGFLGLRQTSPGPMALGSTLQGRVVILGFERRVELMVTEWDPPHSGTLSIEGAGIRSGLLSMTLEATAEGTRMVRTSEFEPRPVLKPLFWVLLPYFRRQAKATNQATKRLIEAEHTSGS